MAFVIAQKASYPWTVNVHTADPQKPGRWKTQTFIGHFKKLADAEFRERLEALLDKELDGNERYARENEFLSEFLLGWEGVTDEEGAPIPFTPEHRDALLNITEVRAALFAALFERKKADVKN